MKIAGVSVRRVEDNTEAVEKNLDRVEETLTYVDFPFENCIHIRTKNVIERLTQEIPRSIRVHGAFKHYVEFLDYLLICPPKITSKESAIRDNKRKSSANCMLVFSQQRTANDKRSPT